MGEEAGSSKIFSKIQLKLEKSGRKYIPETHCIFCLSKGTKAKPLYSTDNGRALVVKVCGTVVLLYASSIFLGRSIRCKHFHHISPVTMCDYQAADIRDDEEIKSRIRQAPETFQYHGKEYRCYKGYVHEKNLEVESSKRKREQELKVTDQRIWNIILKL